jgi:hypothetical protein
MNKTQTQTDKDLADAIHYLGEHLEATETIAARLKRNLGYKVDLPLCHVHAKRALALIEIRHNLRVRIAAIKG